MTRAPGVTAIVLAGGRSTRFGAPKLGVEIDGQPLLERAIEATAAVADSIIVAGAALPAAPPDPVGAVSILTVADDEPFAGPLAGLSGALKQTATGLAIVVGGDMPALVPAVLRAMLGRLRSDEAIDAVLLGSPPPESGSDTAHDAEPPRRQVLPVAVDAAVASVAALAALAAGDRSLVRLLDRLRVHEIPSGEWLAFDATGRTLFDIDRPADVARIRHELR